MAPFVAVVTAFTSTRRATTVIEELVPSPLVNVLWMKTFSTLLMLSRDVSTFVVLLLLMAVVNTLPPAKLLPTYTSFESRFVTIRSRSLTSLVATAGLPGGSVQTNVARNGTRRPAWEVVMFQV